MYKPDDHTYKKKIDCMIQAGEDWKRDKIECRLPTGILSPTEFKLIKDNLTKYIYVSHTVDHPDIDKVDLLETTRIKLYRKLMAIAREDEMSYIDLDKEYYYFEYVTKKVKGLRKLLSYIFKPKPIAVTCHVFFRKGKSI